MIDTFKCKLNFFHTMQRRTLLIICLTCLAFLICAAILLIIFLWRPWGASPNQSIENSTTTSSSSTTRPTTTSNTTLFSTTRTTSSITLTRTTSPITTTASMTATTMPILPTRPREILIDIIQRTECEYYVKKVCQDPPIIDPIPVGVKNPHMVYIRRYMSSSPAFCSGTLISDRFVLTAASCAALLGINIDNRKYLRMTLGDPPAWYRDVDNVIIHRSYNHTQPSTRQFDIALLKFQPPVEIKFQIRPICLNTNFNLIHVRNFTNVGFVPIFDVDEEGNKVLISQELKEVGQYIDEQVLSECLSKFKEFNSSMICARQLPTDGNSQLCMGSTGGSLHISLKTQYACENSYVQMGIASNVTKQCRPLDESLVLYTKIDQHMYWIVSHVWPETLL